MGNKTTSGQFIKQYFPRGTYNWISYPLLDKNKLYNEKLVKDELAGLIGQKYTIHSSDTLQYELLTFLFRKQNSSCLVTVYDIQLVQNSSSIVPNCMYYEHDKTFALIIERVPYRLADIGMIKFEEMIYILEQCFKGLQVLYDRLGMNYLIDEDYISFNEQGECKIWINQNHIKNISSIDISFEQQTIIEQLFQNLESRIDSVVPSYYCNVRAGNSLISFNQALSMLQKIRKKQNIQVYSIQSLKMKNLPNDKQKAIRSQNMMKNNKAYSEQKRSDKFSLKNSRLNNHQKYPQIKIKKEETTDASGLQLDKMIDEDLNQMQFLINSCRSIKNQKKKIHLRFAQYSQKIKGKSSESPMKIARKSLNPKQAYFLKRPPALIK